MDTVKNITKKGWQPEGRLGAAVHKKSTWLPGKKEDPIKTAQDHRSRPLESLKDPSAFGPPPKNVNYHDPSAASNGKVPDNRGLGAPLTAGEVHAVNRFREHDAEAVEKPKPPPVPFRANTSGLSTSNLPAPPVRRIAEDGQISGTTSTHTSIAPKPTLPPRLPPRQNSNPINGESSPPPPYSPSLPARGNISPYGSTGAANRLASAGIRVPDLGIGSNASSQDTTPSQTQPRPGISELGSRFGRLSTQSQSPEPPSRGTSIAEKQAAFKTAQSFRQDPSSVSFADARNAASTADNFRQRHGDQVASGFRSANDFNQKHDISGRVNGLANENQSAHIAANKKPPPPPPPSKLSAGDGSSTNSPPPIPLSSKPKP